MNEQSEFSSLPQNFYKLMLIKRVFFVLILLVVLLVNYFVLNKENLPELVFWLVFIMFFLFATFLLAMTKVYYKNKKFRLYDKNLTYKSGVFVYTEVVVPFSRIQHVEIDEGPLERYFGLATLSIYTAGDSGKDLKINGLEKQEAQSMKEFVTNYIKNE